MMLNQQKGAGRGLRKAVSLLLAVCTVFLCAPLAAADSAGSTPEAVTDSDTRSFVKLSSSVNLFTTDTTPTSGTVSVASGTVLMLVSENTYTVSSTEYGCLYYNNTRYNVLWSDVSGDILTSEELTTYVTGTLWQVTTYESLKKEYSSIGTAVYGLQLALKTLGYYTSSMDGAYGEYTQKAVKAFQNAYGLEADGYAGPVTQKVLYPLATAAYNGTTDSATTGTVTTTVDLNLRKSYAASSARLNVVPAGTSRTYTSAKVSDGVTWYYVTYDGTSGWLMGTYVTVSSSSSSSLGTVTTSASVNLRKSYSTSSARLAVVPKSTTLSYSNTKVSGGITWYYVIYNSLKGWLMGTYTSGSTSGDVTSSIGTVTATSNVVVRKTANGSRTGYLLSKGSEADLLASPTTSGSYTWYYIKMSNGVTGYVRGDYVTVSYDASNGITPSTVKTYVKLPASVTLFTSDEESTTGAVTVSSGTWLQMVSTATYTTNSVVYCSLYYNNEQYNCVYGDVSGGIQSASELTDHITDDLWPAGYVKTMKADLDLLGDIDVHSLQYALTLLGYYTGTLDGNFGSGTTSAVRNFQRAKSLTVDGSVGTETAAVLYPAAIAALTGTTVTDFGTITDITMTDWDTIVSDGLFAKNTTATIMDIGTSMVFKIKRWSGVNHADCVPLTAADTKIMCDIVGFTYAGSPTSSQISKIVSSNENDSSSSVTYTWPDFNGKLTSVTSIGSKWDRRAALLNVNGHVYCVSIYGFPHGYSDIMSFTPSPSTTNYYGMMCVHFKGSKTHSSGTTDTQHQANIEAAYAWAKAKWPTLCK
jgi:peptidoglycan hydrolase-like protein with peptidoglycan-binding domain